MRTGQVMAITHAAIEATGGLFSYVWDRRHEQAANPFVVVYLPIWILPFGRDVMCVVSNTPSSLLYSGT